MSSTLGRVIIAKYSTPVHKWRSLNCVMVVRSEHRNGEWNYFTYLYLDLFHSSEYIARRPLVGSAGFQVLPLSLCQKHINSLLLVLLCHVFVEGVALSGVSNFLKRCSVSNFFTCTRTHQSHSLKET